MKTVVSNSTFDHEVFSDLGPMAGSVAGRENAGSVRDVAACVGRRAGEPSPEGPSSLASTSNGLM